MKKANKTPDIIPAQDFRDRLKAVGFSDYECDEAISSGIILGLFSPAVGRGGVPCYKASCNAGFKLKDVGKFLLSAWSECE